MTERKAGEEEEPSEDATPFGEAPEESPKEGMGDAGGSHAIPKETQIHLFRAFSELAMAMDTVIPKSRMPEEAKEHAKAAKKELLLMMRALIDAKIEREQKKEGEKGPRLKKIKVE